jgi:hypothetical protein
MCAVDLNLNINDDEYDAFEASKDRSAEAFLRERNADLN